MTLGIQKKLALSFSGFLVLAFALILVATLSYVSRETLQTIQQQQFAMTELIARSLDDKLGSMLVEISHMGQLVPEAAFHSPAQGQTFLRQHRHYLNVFDGIALVDRNYNYVSGLPHDPGLDGRPVLALRPFLGRVRDFGLPDFSEPYLSPKTNGPALAVAYPVENHFGITLGFVVGRINLNKDNFVEDLISYRIGKQGYLYVINQDRTLILHPDKSRLMKRDVPRGSNKLLERALAGFEGSGETVNSRGVSQIMSVKQLRTVDWVLATVFPRDEALAGLRRLRYLLVLGFVAITVVAVGLIWLLTMRVTANLGSFTRQIREIKEDTQRSRPITIDGGDEVALLADTFNDLMGELNRTRDSLEELSKTDPLTGLHNRRHFLEQVPRLIALSQRQRTSMTLLMVDLDHFKRINDGFGHDVGDAVLVQVADILRQAVRPYDLVIRHGGEEFLVMLPMTSQADAWHIAERIREKVAALSCPCRTGTLSVSVSIGGCSTSTLTDIQDIIVMADSALYDAKNGGRNRVCLTQYEVPATPAPSECAGEASRPRSA